LLILESQEVGKTGKGVEETGQNVWGKLICNSKLWCIQ